MGAGANNEGKEIRVPVEVPSLLGGEAECVIHGLRVTLFAGGAEVSLTASDFDRRAGRALHFCSRAQPIGELCIEFAGMGRDAWYEVVCKDGATAEMLAERIEKWLGELPKRTPRSAP